MRLAANADLLRDAMVREAIDALTLKPVRATTLERIRLFTQADEALPSDMPQPLKYGHGLSYVLDRIDIPVDPNDLLIGRIREEVPDEAGEAYFQEMCVRYARKALPWDKGTQPFWVFDQGHTSFYWRDLVDLGLSGLRDRAQRRLDRAREDGEGRKVEDFLAGALLSYDAIIRYLRRSAEAARGAGLQEAAEACFHAATRAPRTFREALQMLWAVMLIYDSMLAGNPTLTYGRMDLFLQPLYERDLAEGRLTREEAGLLVLDFYCKNNLIMGRGEHQLSINDPDISTGWQRNLNFDAPQYLILGGTREDGGDAVSDLTLLMAEQVIPRFKNPVIVVRYAPGMMTGHADVWRVLADKMRQSASMMVYNERDVISAYVRAGVLERDAVTFEHYGCNWPVIPGMDGGGCGHLYMWGEGITEEEWARMDGDWWNGLGPGGITGVFTRLLHRFANDPEGAHTIDDFYDALSEAYERAIRKRFDHALLERELLMRQRPGVLLYMDLFFKDTIERAANHMCGGCQYYAIGNSYGGFATLVDCVSAVDALVYRDNRLTLRQFADALEANYEGYAWVRALARSVPKLGSDDPHANAHGRRALEALTDASYRAAVAYEQYNRPDNRFVLRQSIETDTGHIRMGAQLGATPDGRLAGEPLSQNCQPTEGASVNGLTARFQSMAQLPLDRIMSGAQNITIQPRLFKGEAGLDKLAYAVGTYFELGGLQTQISAVDVAELRDAQRRPDAHRDLMVRITGYSAVFVDMNKLAQDDIIRREEMGA